MTHPGAPRDVDLAAWLRGFGFHPANTQAKQLGHEIARQQVANVAGVLHAMIPPGREKTLVFSHLELVLMFANKALAVGGGPRPVVSEDEAEEVEALTRVLASLREEGAMFGALLPQDPRIEEYAAQQRGEGPLDALPFPVPDVVKEQAARPS